ncbi:MAG: four helix bundle protein [Terriglobia bacterium]
MNGSSHRAIGRSDHLSSETSHILNTTGEGLVLSDLHQQLRERTKQFAIRVVKMVQRLPKTDEARTMGRQLLRSGTSVAANYRAVGRARSKAEFIAKMGVVVEEADETVFWLELLIDTGIVRKDQTQELLGESNELLAIFAASHRTAKSRGGKFEEAA